ncbi:MAG: hypothetical protein O7D91_21825, partial [Planctomycetota bacterium]|nr:hypothetical protein [Planctomycetota bacterium]
MPHINHRLRTKLHLMRPSALLPAFLSALAFAACGSDESTETAAAAPEKPNVVYILSDTHRWGAMSFTQTPGVQTPNLETL